MIKNNHELQAIITVISVIFTISMSTIAVFWALENRWKSNKEVRKIIISRKADPHKFSLKSCIEKCKNVKFSQSRLEFPTTTLLILLFFSLSCVFLRLCSVFHQKSLRSSHICDDFAITDASLIKV